jgi:hypothetical protein
MATFGLPSRNLIPIDDEGKLINDSFLRYLDDRAAALEAATSKRKQAKDPAGVEKVSQSVRTNPKRNSYGLIDFNWTYRDKAQKIKRQVVVTTVGHGM